MSGRVHAEGEHRRSCGGTPRSNDPEHPLLDVQRTAGNRAVTDALARSAEQEGGGGGGKGPDLEVRINGSVVPPSDIVHSEIERDFSGPDAAKIRLKNESGQYGDLKQGASVEILSKRDGKTVTVFEGVIAGLEPVDRVGKGDLLIRALNRLHRVLRQNAMATA